MAICGEWMFKAITLIALLYCSIILARAETILSSDDFPKEVGQLYTRSGCPNIKKGEVRRLERYKHSIFAYGVFAGEPTDSVVFFCKIKDQQYNRQYPFEFLIAARSAKTGKLEVVDRIERNLYTYPGLRVLNSSGTRESIIRAGHAVAPVSIRLADILRSNEMSVIVLGVGPTGDYYTVLDGIWWTVLVD